MPRFVSPAFGALVGLTACLPGRACADPGSSAVKEFTAPVTCVAYSPDGKLLAAATWAGQGDRRHTVVVLWDTARLTERATLKHRGSLVAQLAFSPDGKTLAVACRRQNEGYGHVLIDLVLWDVAKARERAVVSVDREVWGDHCLAYSPDGKLLALAEHDRDEKDDVKRGYVTLRSPQTGQVQRTLTLGRCLPETLAFSPDCKLLAVCDPPGIQHPYQQDGVWELATGKRLFRIGTHKAMAFSPDGKTIAALSPTGSSVGGSSVLFYDVGTGQIRDRLPQGPHLAYWDLALSPDGKRLATSSVWKAEVVVWDVASRSEALRLRGHGNTVISLAFAPGGKTLASGSRDGTVRTWDLASGKETAVLEYGVTRLPAGQSPPPAPDTAAPVCFKGHTMTVHSLAFTPDGRTLISGAWDGTVRLWDVATGKGETLAAVASGLGPKRLALAPDGKTLVFTGVTSDAERQHWNSEDWGTVVWDLPARAARCTLPSSLREPGSINSGFVAITPDGKTVAVGVRRAIEVWDLAERKRPRARLRDDQATESALVAFSPDGKTLASSARGFWTSLRLWDPATGKKLASWQAEGEIGQLQFSPDGRWLVGAQISVPNRKSTTLTDSTEDLLLWDPRSGSSLETLKGWGRCFAFAPDGKSLATGTLDAEVKLWDLATRKVVRTFRGHTGPLHTLAFSPDGRLLASGGQDGTIRLWDLAPATPPVRPTPPAPPPEVKPAPPKSAPPPEAKPTPTPPAPKPPAEPPALRAPSPPAGSEPMLDKTLSPDSQTAAAQAPETDAASESSGGKPRRWTLLLLALGVLGAAGGVGAIWLAVHWLEHRRQGKPLPSRPGPRKWPPTSPRSGKKPR